MFGLIEGLAKAAVATVTLPVAVVADAITLGGSLTDKERPYTADAASAIMSNIKNAVTPEK